MALLSLLNIAELGTFQSLLTRSDFNIFVDSNSDFKGRLGGTGTLEASSHSFTLQVCGCCLCGSYQPWTEHTLEILCTHHINLQKSFPCLPLKISVTSIYTAVMMHWAWGNFDLISSMRGNSRQIPGRFKGSEYLKTFITVRFWMQPLWIPGDNSVYFS